ncbi:MAG: hypothetical protein FJX35_00660 [Alphaproteobacteria bacterium]|nr:hypothetical protein [Alphaproteobacteria bacterium]
MTIRMSLKEAYELCRAALLASGANESNAVPVAKSLEDAEAEGIRNVGLGYLSHYCVNAGVKMHRLAGVKVRHG